MPAEVTQLLGALERGDPHAAEELLPLVYQDLRRLAAVKMAAEAPGHTLQATALVHEAWVRVAGEGHSWNDRQHFFRIAAEAMRRILIDRARSKRRQKRGAGAEHVSLDDVAIIAADSDEQLLQIHEVLDDLAAESPALAELIKLRFFVGLRMTEIAGVMGISPTTAKRHFTYARAWLVARFKNGD
jgi:RNA polymerase sigma factor (TIGR02999 family)